MINSKGYTLVELVVAMAVTAIVFAIIFAFYRQADKAYQGNLRFSGMNYNAIQLVKQVEENLMNAKGVVLLSENEIKFKKQNGIIGTYRWDGQTLWYNGIKLAGRNSGLSCVMILPSNNSLMASDKNGDGVITENELAYIHSMTMKFDFILHGDSAGYVFAQRLRPSSND